MIKKDITLNDEPLTDFFSFPVITADGEAEMKKIHKLNDKKQRYGDMPNDEPEEIEPLDTVTATAEYPYTLFIGVVDRWLPTEESFDKAKGKNFEACLVTFANLGTHVVPWTRQKFKEKFSKFVMEFDRRRKQKQQEELKNNPPPPPKPQMVPVFLMPNKEDGQ